MIGLEYQLRRLKIEFRQEKRNNNNINNQLSFLVRYEYRIDQQSIIGKNITLYMFVSVCFYPSRTKRKINNRWNEREREEKAERRQKKT